MNASSRAAYLNPRAHFVLWEDRAIMPAPSKTIGLRTRCRFGMKGAVMELRQLRYFTMVARQRHFGRAADALRVAQPALSRQVAKLEDELGIRLLDRHARGVSLTPEGEVILARAEALVAEADALLEEARAPLAEPQGTVTLGFSPSVAELFGGQLAALTLRRYPKVRLRITTAASPVLEGWIHQGRVDIAILNGPTDPSRFLLTPLLEEPVCLIARPGDPHFAVRRLTLAALSGLPLVLTGPPDGPMQRVLVAAQAQAGQTLNALVQVDTAAVGRELVLSGVGSMVEVAAVVRHELASGTLKAVPIADLRIQRFLARAKGRAGSDAVARVAGLMRDCVAEMVAQGSWPGAVEITAL
ncbi:LysR family transcriptional regulator [Roseomonas populi]|uniref:LysR family transcriptional regulator n=1 Tax=Roseomonas populi TaxID=3121582 RepID=A0ABT1X4T6_9PROT|nr:LysR family transcriptional regulator [Roseomonas pecuniae]MCR0983108.1 LysR family transcriptional regulator [Roseomonas pecuniae]